MGYNSTKTQTHGTRTEPTENEIRSAQLWQGPYTDPGRDNKYYTLTKDITIGGNRKPFVAPAGTCALGKDWDETVEKRPSPALWIDFLREATEDEITKATTQS